jgi:SAM-dependent methyltransferase
MNAGDGRAMRTPGAQRPATATFWQTPRQADHAQQADDMRSTTQEMAEITAATLAHYAGRAEAFWAGTRDHDVRQNITALLSRIDGSSTFAILDFGCGPGRDLKTFADLGHVAIGLDGAAPFAAMARAHSGCEVWEQDFLRLDLPIERFDGIFANASLFHVPAQELPRVLGELRSALKPSGVLFTSNPRGEDQEGWHGGRYGVLWSLPTWQAHLAAADFAELGHYFRPDGLPRARQPWLASLWRKPARTAR